MPADFFIDIRLGVVFSKATGVFDSADAMDHMGRLQNHPDFRPDFNQLFDFRDVNTVMLSAGEVRQLAKQSIFSVSSHRAFVVPGDLEFGLARMFGTYRDLEGESGIVSFRLMGKALAWLSLSVEPEPSMFAKLYTTATEAAQGTSS
ncbi:MAG: hypothetical protein C0467_25220 [Planctomycetaceae bacterium]|nr:hypothetical protein [Planctomycetaceae bacterium]